MTDQTPSQSPPASVECPAAKDSAVRMFIFAALLIGFGIYCFADHYIWGNYKYPDPFKLNPYLGYLLNHYGPFVFLPPGLLLLVWGIVAMRRRLVADEQGIGYVGKPKIPWSAITTVDSSKLADKGVLLIGYTLEERPAVLKLDSWKLQNFRDLVALIESKALVAGEGT